jgi:hypothetical protein
MKVLKDGATVYEGMVRPSIGADGDVSNSMPADAVFDVAPGRMRVQMTVADAASRPLDQDVRDVIVGTLAGQVALGTAQVFRARNAREYRDTETDPGAVPVATRDFNRTERLLVRVPAYATAGKPSVTARLLGRTSAQIRVLDVRPAPATDVYQLDLPLAGLANGDYTIELAIAASGAEAKQAVPFRLVP